jgi:dihydrofolate reductase
MPRIIVVALSTLDGVVQDPTGEERTGEERFTHGGWAYREGPEAVADDQFEHDRPAHEHGSLLQALLAPAALETGVLLFGRKTWEIFSRIYAHRSDDLGAAMNRVPKLVASRSLADVSGWPNSSLIENDLVTTVQQQKGDRDVIVVGSASVVHALGQRNLVDEYRILMFPSALGGGERLFTPETTPISLRLLSAEAAGQAVLLRYERAGG